MNILLTNDDGIGSKCLHELAVRLRNEHTVWIVAPVEERSACSHSITLHGTIKFKQTGLQDYACWGSPADCVLVSLLGFIPEPIDFVISGPNQGPNLGTDLIYSGTAAGARQAALMGKPALAASIHTFKPPYNHALASEFIAKNINLLRDLWEPDHFININFPNDPVKEVRPAVTLPSRRIYKDRLTTYNAPDDCIYAFLTGEYPGSTENTEDDCYAIKQDCISISPISLFPENIKNWEKYRQVKFQE